jgi:hypothetical protein
VLVEREGIAALFDLGDDLLLEAVVAAIDRAIALEVFAGIVVVGGAAHERRRSLGDALHLLFDLGEVVRRDLPVGIINIVVKAVLDGRSDGQLRLGEHAQNGVRHQMRGGVPQHLERFGVALRQELHLGAVRQLPTEVDDVAIDFGGNGRTCEAWTNAGG